jgi:signal transduction histidine kinase
MADPGFDKAKSVMSLKLRSIMCVPLISQGDRTGAIYVENRSIQGRFDDNDLTLLILFANQAAVSIENARLNTNLEMRVAARTKELRQAMLQVEKSWEEAVEANRLRMVWLNNFTHDLRTSLSVVSGSLMLLQTDKLGSLNDKQKNWIDQSLTAVNHTIELINDLLDLSKLDANGLTLSPEEVDLSDFLKNVHEIGLRLPWSETVTLELNIPAELPTMSLDPVRIRQVLFNLLSNAHKFTTQGRVTLHARHLVDQGEVLLGVADTGEGIPIHKLDRLFERFQQVDENAERRQIGSGLGLAICRELIEMHGGRIWVESTPGLGSNFIFTLPLGSPDPNAKNNS